MALTSSTKARAQRRTGFPPAPVANATTALCHSNCGSLLLGRGGVYSRRRRGEKGSTVVGGQGPNVPLEPLRSRDPREVGGYRLLGRLGAGGMGVAYLGEDDSGTWVVVKVMREDLADDQSFRARLRREIEAMQRVSGTHTAGILAFDVDCDRPYLVMEYVPGITLLQHVKDLGPLPVNELQALAADLAAALAEIHQSGVIHRDLKPGNIMLSPTGVRLIDFGVADLTDATALTSTSMVVGSAGWLAPEQLMGEDVTTATDVHAWGCVVLFGATGQPPFGGGNSAAAVYKVVQETPPVPTTLEPPALRQLVIAALAKDPSQRPAVTELLPRQAGATSVEPQPLKPAGMQTGAAAAVPRAAVAVPHPVEAMANTEPEPSRRGWPVLTYVLAVIAALAFGLLVGVLVARSSGSASGVIVIRAEPHESPATVGH